MLFLFSIKTFFPVKTFALKNTLKEPSLNPTLMHFHTCTLESCHGSQSIVLSHFSARPLRGDRPSWGLSHLTPLKIPSLVCVLKGLAVGTVSGQAELAWERLVISQQLRGKAVGEGSRDSSQDGEQQEQGVHPC